MIIFDQVCGADVIANYLTKIRTHFLSMLDRGEDYFAFYPTRNIMLNLDDPLIQYITKYIESNLKVKLTCYDAELQTWPIDSESALHKHTFDNREHGDYNSLLYLNENFTGGEFYTENIIIKPKTNRLTFFDGSTVLHGVNKVAVDHRHTVIFWWKNTQFYQ